MPGQTFHVVINPDNGWPHVFADADQAQRFADASGADDPQAADVIDGESGEALIADYSEE